MFEIHAYIPPYVSHWVFVALLCGLQVLHVFWTYLILKIALQKFTHGAVSCHFLLTNSYYRYILYHHQLVLASRSQRLNTL